MIHVVNSDRRETDCILELQRLGVLLLTARPLEVHNQFARHSHCDARPIIFFNQRKR